MTRARVIGHSGGGRISLGTSVRGLARLDNDLEPRIPMQPNLPRCGREASFPRMASFPGSRCVCVWGGGGGGGTDGLMVWEALIYQNQDMT